MCSASKNVASIGRETVSFGEGSAFDMSQMTYSNIDVLNSQYNSLQFTQMKVARPIAMGELTITDNGETQACDYELGAPVNGRSRIEVHAKAGSELSPLGKFHSRLGIAALWAAGLIGIGAAAPKDADASIISTLTPDSTYVQNGTAMVNSGQLTSATITVEGITGTASSVPIAPNLILLAGHEVAGNGLTADSVTVSTAPNYQTGGGVSDPVTRLIIIPGFNSTFNQPDAAIGVLAHDLPFSGMTITSIAPTVGSSEKFGGFGLSSVSGGTPVQDGNARGWQMLISAVNPNNVSDVYYISAGSGGQAGTANGYYNDSGGAVINPITNTLDGIMDAQEGGNTLPGVTSFLNLAESDTHTWLIDTVNEYGDGGPNMTTPEPSSLAVVGIMSLGLLARNRRRQAKA